MAGNTRSFVTMSLVAMLAGSPVSAFAARNEAPPAPLTSTLADQTGMALTVYNSNLGLVKDRRLVRLPNGVGELRFMDVAARINPASVLIKATTDPDTLRVLEQNYEYDLLSPQKLLDKYLGKEVKLYQKNQYTEREETVTATLLANNDGPIFKIGNDITFNYPGRIIFPGLPEGLIPKPTLVWTLDNRQEKPREIEASYLTDGISWRADYVVTLDADDRKADLAGWVTIDNKSGATYRDARLKLVAGEINRVQEEPVYREKTVRMAMAAPAPEFKEEGFFEYHIYTLQRSSTIRDNQTKQISLMTADGIPVKKELVLKGVGNYYRGPYGDGDVKQKVGVYVEMENRQQNRLGMPLPKGVIRVYKRDSDGSLQFIGEDAVDHTPVDEKIRIKVGEAFDIVASRKQTDWKKIASDSYEAAFEITLRNHKKEAVTVKVVETVPGDWTMLDSSLPYTKSGAFAAEFLVPVPKNGETKLTYRVRMRY
jgi:hypothetical protein